MLRKKPKWMQKTLAIFWKVMFWLFVCAITIHVVFPFYWTVISAFKSDDQLAMTPATLLPINPIEGGISFSFDNFHLVLSNPLFYRALFNSLVVSVLTVFFSGMFGSFAAFALGKLRFRGRKPALLIILSMTMFPQIAVLTGLYSIIRVLGIPAIPSMITTYQLFALPFIIWILTSYFRGLPDSLFQAAQVDGATMMQSFWYILLPLTMPALATTGLLGFIACWNEYLFALTFSAVEPQARTVTVAIANFGGTIPHHIPFGEIMAAAVIVTVPLVVMVFFFQKRIISGLTAGSVKE
ncbi:MAG: carbohydrate ABC transporter permease [Spirochaetia bacterium]